LALQKFYKTKNDLSIGLWKIEENELFFKEQLHLSEIEEQELSELSQRKQIEWLASRYLLHLTLGKEDRYSCIKDDHGKPYLLGLNQYISLSHSRDYVATIFGNKPCGIDIQYYIDKITMISKKFVTNTEWSFINMEQKIAYLHAIWSVKESVYKAYGKKGTSLLNDILVHPFELDNNYKAEIYATLDKDGFQKKYKCEHNVFEDFTIVYAFEV
jgi:phosphopantetheinyl transferase